MSNSTFTSWLSENKTVAGLLALVVSAPGQSALIEECSASFPGTSFDTGWRCLAETISVLQINDFPTGCFRFIFEQALVHCERREDGVCIGVFASRGVTRLPS